MQCPWPRARAYYLEVPVIDILGFTVCHQSSKYSEWSQTIWFTSWLCHLNPRCVTLCKLLNLSGPLTPHLDHGDSHGAFWGVLFFVYCEAQVSLYLFHTVQPFVRLKNMQN